MKYNKEKVKKFAIGGKTPQEIMAEARRNQAIERQAQTRDVVANAGIPAYQSTPVTINTPRPTVELKEYAKPKTFGEAFAEARRSGLKEFKYNGKSYTTELANTEATNTAPTVSNINRTNVTYVGKELPPVYIDAQRINREPVRTTSFWERLKNWPRYSLGLITPQEMYGYKKGGKVKDTSKDKPKEEIPVRNIIERFFGKEPEYKPVNPEESITSYIDDPLLGKRKLISVIKKTVPYGKGYLRSTREIINPGTTEADTIYIAPSGKSFDNRFIDKNSGYGSYREKFNRYFKYQKGGKTSKVPDELYMDFAVRFLKAIGISEDQMIDSKSGTFKEEYIDPIAQALQEVDFPEFWEEYKVNPDRMVTSYIETKQSPEEVELAKKGAKLKKLKSTKKKCKCGCDLVLKKDAGGALVEVCACGCKN